MGKKLKLNANSRIWYYGHNGQNGIILGCFTLIRDLFVT